LVAGAVKFDSARFENAGYEDTLRREAVRLGVQDDVWFLGERDDVPLVLRALDVLVVPSWEEPLGRLVLEGMASGLPVLATAVGGPAEIVEPGIDGLLLPPHEPKRWARAVTELLADPTRRKSMGEAARRKAEAGFGVRSPVDAAVDAYAAALGRGAAKRQGLPHRGPVGEIS
jgi:glycosyltransferase involved in cell wall biosynthesis